jgi:uncharacterized protein
MEVIDQCIRQFERDYPLNKVFKSCDDYYIYDGRSNFILSLAAEELVLLHEYLYKRGGVFPNGQESLWDKFEHLKSVGFFKKGNMKAVSPSLDTDIENFNNYFKENTLPRKFILELTEDCNLRCQYCFFTIGTENRIHRNKSMSLDTAFKAIDYYFERYTQALLKVPIEKREKVQKVAVPNIGWWGGEAFLEFEKIKKTKEYFENLPWEKFGVCKSNLHYTVISNFTVVNDEIIDFILDSNFYLFISLDGDKESNDTNRKFRDNSGTYETVTKNINKLVQKNPDFAKEKLFIQSVLAENTDHKRCIKHLKSEFQNTGIVKKVLFFPQKVEQNILPKTQNISNLGRFVEIIENMLNKSDEEVFKMLDDNSNLFDEFDKIISLGDRINVDVPLANDIANRHFSCPIGHDVIFVSVDGDFHACEKSDYSYSFGNLTEKINDGKLNQLYKDYYKEINNNCTSCWAFNFCQVCPVLLLNNGKFKSPSDQECMKIRNQIYEEITKYLILLDQDHLVESISKYRAQNKTLSFLDYDRAIMADQFN